MFVHQIVKHTKPPTTAYYPAVYEPRPIADYRMSKLEYAMYVKNLPFRPGDLLVAKNSFPPYHVQEIYKLVNIDEIHRFVQFCLPEVGPLCLEMEYFNGRTRSSRGGGSCYKKVEEWDIPRAWKERDIVDV